MANGSITLFMCGDVMLGRGVDQILPRPGDPALRERHLRDARDYVGLAEQVNGPVPGPVDVTWPWGDALTVLDAVAPDARVVNLETSVTTSDGFAPGKAVHYRMNPANLLALSAARPDVCALANNHVLDFGHRGLLDALGGSRSRHRACELRRSTARQDRRCVVRLVYLIFDGLLNRLTLLGRASASKTSNCSSYATKSPYSAEPTRGLAWTGPTEPCSPR
jgi:hypothetical protein